MNPLDNGNKPTGFEIKFRVTKGETVGGGINWEDGINTYTPLYIKEKANKGLLHSAGRAAQCSQKSYTGVKMDVYA